MSLPFTNGAWTFSPLHEDSVTTPKSVSVTDVDVPAEFTASLAPTNPSSKTDLDQVMYYSDQTGDGMQPVGHMALGRKAVRNVYSSADIGASEQLPQKGGMRVYLNLVEYFKAVNSVSGAEYIFPVSGSLSIVIPTWSALPEDVLINFYNHLDGVARTDGTATQPIPAIVAALRGDVDMTR